MRLHLPPPAVLVLLNISYCSQERRRRRSRRRTSAANLSYFHLNLIFYIAEASRAELPQLLQWHHSEVEHHSQDTL